MPDLTYVDLFCGCGGLSLGLESAGFSRLFSNDVSAMAAETFAYNLVEGAQDGKQPGRRTLGGDAFSFLVRPPVGEDGHIDEAIYRGKGRDSWSQGRVSNEASRFFREGVGSDLIVGDAVKLASFLQQNGRRGISKRLAEVDLLAGGPPCQSFSLAGKRERDNPRNQLFRSFVSIASILQPKIILFENVLGITSPFSDEDGNRWYPWFEVCRAFRARGYVPIPSLVDASLYGVPQTRMRFIMVALRQDVAREAAAAIGKKDPLGHRISVGFDSFSRSRKWEKGDDEELILRPDGSRSEWCSSLLPVPLAGTPVSVGDAIGDLVETESEFLPGLCPRNAFSLSLDGEFPAPEWHTNRVYSGALNHSPRKHAGKALARFRLMRSLADSGWRPKSMSQVNKDFGVRAARLLLGKHLLFLNEDGTLSEKRATRKNVRDLVEQLASAKHAQRCLNPDAPAPAQLSIPDDYIHWERDRVLTIREMARIQTFPDWFMLRSKETTGGDARAYEVPQYTQVGNAVPPLLARKFGQSIHTFLRRIGRRKIH